VRANIQSSLRACVECMCCDLLQLLDFALTREVVALFSGWDLSRDISTHHLQEKLFDAHCQMARKIHLPLVVRPVLATEKIVEKLTAERGHESEASASNARVAAVLGGASAAAVPSLEHHTSLQVAVLGLNETTPLADVAALVSLGVYFGVDASFTADGADTDAWTGTRVCHLWPRTTSMV
jgi:hypothetical protein